MLRRLTTLERCGQCRQPFKVFETVHYLGIDNNSFCAECREKIAPGKSDDPDGLGGWVPTLFVGGYSEGRNNILQLIKLWNNKLDDSEHNLRIELEGQIKRFGKENFPDHQLGGF